MDHMLYTAMTGISRVMEAQTQNANNIANANTTGFKAELMRSGAFPVDGPGFPTRVATINEGSGADLAPGAAIATGNPLDVTIQGEGWFVVQVPGGGEALSRRGDFEIDANGVLRNGAGMPLMGETGPVAIPPYETVTFGVDGTISIVPIGQDPDAPAVLDRLLLVRPDDPAQLQRGADGLFRLPNDEIPPPAADIRLLTGHLEASNVNLAQTMVEMISLQRQFEMQVRMLRMASDNADSSAMLLSSGR
ncbi:MAG: flagellar basal body rod protein FlgF [Wenzhouxiangellaceae bacterium]|nr:flagellar basal body rod protein FlgF [Wenzhouxiangellaceae bacterium]